MIRITFFGSPEFAVPSLETLAHDARFSVSAVVTQPDKPRGRGNKLQPTPVALAAKELNIPVIKSNLKAPSPPLTKEGAAGEVAADLFVVVAYGALLSASLLAIPQYGAVNLHPSLLPRYRGASPLQTAILHGDAETGVTVMLLDAELDHGPILWQEPVPLEHHDTAETLSERIAGIGAKLLATTIPLYIKGEIKPKPQDHAAATFTKQIAKRDGKIDWHMPADKIARMIHAYYPWPSAWTTFFDHGKTKVLKIISATPRPSPLSVRGAGGVTSTRCGTLITPFNPPYLKGENLIGCVVCGDQSILQLHTIQPSGKKPMSIDAFLNGRKDFLNQTLGAHT